MSLEELVGFHHPFLCPLLEDCLGSWQTSLGPCTAPSQPLAANPSALSSGRIIQPPWQGDGSVKSILASQSWARTASVLGKGKASTAPCGCAWKNFSKHRTKHPKWSSTPQNCCGSAHNPSTQKPGARHCGRGLSMQLLYRSFKEIQNWRENWNCAFFSAFAPCPSSNTPVLAAPSLGPVSAFKLWVGSGFSLVTGIVQPSSEKTQFPSCVYRLDRCSGEDSVSKQRTMPTLPPTIWSLLI